MNQNIYFYQFLEPVSKDLAFIAKQLENSIFTSPRIVLTHSRIFIEHLLHTVIELEDMTDIGQLTLIDRINLLDNNGYLTKEVSNALHYIRQLGNQAAHNPRKFRYSEALLCWEAVYEVVKWFVEVYGSLEIEVPEYQDPSPKKQPMYDIQEIVYKLEEIEKKLTEQTVHPDKQQGIDEMAAMEVKTGFETNEEIPGDTTIRTISYKDKHVDVPYFLRDAFLLPQRFERSETFLIRLGAVQQARIMSELPSNLEGLHRHVKRFKDKNDEIFFHELKVFIEEEKIRRRIAAERPGELFFFFRTDYIVVTEELSAIELKEENFTGIPNLLNQLREDQIERVGQLPKEMLILAKYDRVGVGTVEKLFEQLKGCREDKGLS